jgi:type IV secretion system protein VirD4
MRKSITNNAVGPQIRARQQVKFKKGPLLLVLLALLMSLQGGTQFLAYQFNYHESLGVSVGHLYFPWSLVIWWMKWGSYYPEVFSITLSMLVMINALNLIGILVFNKKRQKENVSEYLHGSAKWADEKDIKEASLLEQEGVYVGAYEDNKGVTHYLRHNGPEHILTYAPTRSGKGVGLVIPTLLSWKHSTVITDLKGELWEYTAGWRKLYAKNKVIRFEPANNSKSACWNPLDEIRVGTDSEVGDVQNLATLIIDPDGKGLETHWQKTSQALLVGLILHAIYKLKNNGEPATFPNIDLMLVDPNLNISDLLIEMTQYKHLAGKPHPVISASARDMLDKHEEEAGSVLSTLKSYLSLYRDPVVAKNVSRSDFSIKDLMSHDTPLSLYIITKPNDKDRLRPLVRVMLNMIVRILADEMSFERTEDCNGISHVKTKQTYNHRLLCMIDEFPSLGKLDILQESLAYVAGYGIKFYLICQDINQLKSRERGYGPDETITSNCHIQNAYPPNRLETAEHLSKMTGLTTVIKEHITTSGKRVSTFLSQISKTEQETSRPLLTIDECLRMPGPKKDKTGLITEVGDMIIYVAGFPAIYGRQPLYFKDTTFLSRASIEPPSATDVIKKHLRDGQEIKL